MSYPNYPNYPGAPTQQPTYPGYPDPRAQAPVYPPYPGTQPGYPAAQVNQYPPAPAPAYPAPTQQTYYPSSAPAYPPYNPATPQQVGYPAGAPVAGQYPTGVGYPTGQVTSSAGYQQVQPQMQLDNPTVTAVSPFDPRVDADIIHKAMKGLGTDENALISILCHRTSYQRAAINQIYKSIYSSKDLETKLKSELSGSFEKLMVALCLPKPVFLAQEIHDAISGIGTKDGTLIEILCSATNQEIREMNAAYARLYGHALETDIRGDTSGDFEMLLVSMAYGQRDENPTVNVQHAKDDAQRLYHAGEGKFGTDERTFNNILTTRSWPHLRQVMIEYENLHGHSLETAVKREFSANSERGLLAILQCAVNRPAYFAQRLNDALRGMGTRDHSLIRIVASRCDIDLGGIKREYEKKYGRSLIKDVSGDTSGDYKHGLLALLG